MSASGPKPQSKPTKTIAGKPASAKPLATKAGPDKPPPPESQPMAEPLVPKIQADGSSALEGLAEILDTAEWDERETQTAKRRPAGRIPLNEKVDTKELLYREAICVISEKGVKGATIREIAKRANLTPAMVHYHFKDKATLVSSTLTRYLKPISDSVWEAAELDIGPLEMLREFHLRLSEVFTKVRWYGSFWSRELAGVHGSQKPFMASLIGENRLKLFREKIELGQKQGLINPLVSPELVFPTLIALVYLPRISLEHWGKVWNTDIDEETVRRHVWGTIIDGLAAKDAGKLK